MGNNGSKPGNSGSKRGKRRSSLHDNLVVDSRKGEKEYDISDDDLGKGSSTKIKSASSKKYTKSSRTQVAIKLYDGKSEAPPDLKYEAELLKECDHPHIVKLFEITKVNRNISLVMELCNGGSLRDRLPYTESQASRIIRQVTSAVHYLHQRNIVHRDLEMGNILFETKDPDSSVKIIDFGCATRLDLIPNKPGAFKFLKEKTGSVPIMAPEVIRGRYGPKCDIWSLGVVTYMLLQKGQAPFQGKTIAEMENSIVQGHINYKNWEHTNDAKVFVQLCTMVNAGNRPAAATLLQNIWLVPDAVNSEVETTKTTRKGDTLPNEMVMSFFLYRKAPALKRMALNALARKYYTNGARQKTYKELFSKLNTSQSGSLSKQEFMAAFSKSGSSQDELEDLFKKLDVNGNGEIMYTEFLAATLEIDGELGEDQLREAFDLLDVNKSGHITKKNLLKILGGNSSHSKEWIQSMLQEFDGKVDYESFARMFEHGFSDSVRDMDTIIETSLNEEQWDHLNKMAMDTERNSIMKTIQEAEA